MICHCLRSLAQLAWLWCVICPVGPVLLFPVLLHLWIIICALQFYALQTSHLFFSDVFALLFCNVCWFKCVSGYIIWLADIDEGSLSLREWLQLEWIEKYCYCWALLVIVILFCIRLCPIKKIKREWDLSFSLYH